MQYVENTVIARRLCVVVKSYIFATVSKLCGRNKKNIIIIIKLLLNQVIDMFFLFYYIQRIIRDIFAMISIHGSLVIQCMESDTN